MKQKMKWFGAFVLAIAGFSQTSTQAAELKTGLLLANNSSQECIELGYPEECCVFENEEPEIPKWCCEDFNPPAPACPK